jgi:hypothetical protein
MHARALLLLAALPLLVGTLPAAADPPVFDRAEAAQITYPVPAFSRWTVLDLRDGSIYARDRIWPRADRMPLVGASTDFAWLMDARTEPPDYDRRLRGYACAAPVVLLDPAPAAG